jgi:hypothetical protein
MWNEGLTQIQGQIYDFLEGWTFWSTEAATLVVGSDGSYRKKTLNALRTEVF